MQAVGSAWRIRGDMVNVASDPLMQVFAAENMPILWQGESGGKAQLLAGT
ncbi:hypothetical protein LQ939_13235 [Pantoea alhagi]|nr:hypothetical protein [Pantoea alhagi]URQ59729.1 hypothetical protein LQ939_13235 [Pantoea alhagi]